VSQLAGVQFYNEFYPERDRKFSVFPKIIFGPLFSKQIHIFYLNGQTRNK